MSNSSTKTALLIVDVQLGFTNEHTRHVIPFIEDVQKNYSIVFVTRFINPVNSQFRRWMKWSRFDPSSNEVDFAFDPRPDAIVVEKSIYSCVNSLFVSKLHEMNIDEVHVCGIDTDVCVTKCATDLFENNIYPVVLSACCASHGGPEIHDWALHILRRLIGRDQVR